MYGENVGSIGCYVSKSTSITINLNLLNFIINKTAYIHKLSNENNHEFAVKFIMDRIYDAAHFEGDEEIIKKYISKAIDSALIWK